MSGPSLHSARFADLDARTFHDILRLRLDTFVVEQGCTYHELDGRDVLTTTEHAWIEVDGEVVCYLRVYPGADGTTSIGRVVTAVAHRGRGLASRLMRQTLAISGRPVRLDAQAQLADWYSALGFHRCGPDFVEDGIVHTPMRLDA
ncbi:MAG: GNAT family N-acetyltransferase [Candidatus Dormibacteraeota bacterium]|nr:GNAT family N-acetyltransferase [Candidatus Dormibacteraeota bacterium]